MIKIGILQKISGLKKAYADHKIKEEETNKKLDEIKIAELERKEKINALQKKINPNSKPQKGLLERFAFE